MAATALAPGAASAQSAAEEYCTPTDPGLAELSGLTYLDGSMYAVGDSGTDDRVAHLDSSCGVVEWLPNPVDPYDVEDLSAFDGSLWLADIGDNDRRRDSVALTRMDTTAGEPGDLVRLTYPDGAHDAEALLIGGNGHPVVVTKDGMGGGGVYTVDRAVTDLPSPGPTALTRVADFAVAATGTPGGPPVLVGSTLVTGGAVSPDGSEVAVRTYTDVYLWSVENDEVAAALTRPPDRILPVPGQPQGEAVAYTEDGDLLIASERGIDAAAPLPPIEVIRAETVQNAPAFAAQATDAQATDAQETGVPADEPAAPAEPEGSIVWPLLGAVASVLVVVAVTAFGLTKLFRSR